MNVRNAHLVVIHDVWTGYSPAAPVSATYELHRGTRGGLAGEGRLSTGGSKAKRVPVSMTGATAEPFLDALAAARLVPGQYQPFQDHTDDYPRIEVVIHVPPTDQGDRGGVALLYTESQSEFHAPWAAFVGGSAYVVMGDQVGRALNGLDRPLKKNVLRRMASE